MVVFVGVFLFFFFGNNNVKYFYFHFSQKHNLDVLCIQSGNYKPFLIFHIYREMEKQFNQCFSNIIIPQLVLAFK